MRKGYLSLIILAASCLARPVFAQEEDPNAVLDASRAAIAELGGFTASFDMRGDGSDMIKSTMPSMNGQLVFGEHPEYGKSVRMYGSARDKAEGETYAIDLLRSKEVLVWVDMKERTINEYPADTTARGVPTAAKLMMFDILLDEDPYGRRLDQAESIAIEAQEQVGGELCDVVRIDYAKPARAAGRSRNVQANYTSARYFISTNDHLPRRIDHITDGGMIKFQMITELTNLVSVKPSDEQIRVNRLEGFTLVSRLKPEEPSEPKQPAGDIPITKPGEKPDTPIGQRLPRAPGFEFTDAEGVKINNASQIGRVTVLYFHGSWCLPCRDTSPLVSSIAESFASQDVDVFAVAVRERDPDAVRSEFRSAGYSARLVLDADEVASRFRVRLYPTIVVVNKGGEIVFEDHLKKDFDGQQLVDATINAVKLAIAG
ncbi:MAG: TlpA family protein disulfide reductase [Phycisphaerales bacterium]|nr:TlpA family protein disulfide reductase [Phycisphaerales bacterium]